MDILAHAIALPNDDEDIVGIADWLESVLLAERRKRLSRATIRKYVRAAYLVDDEPDLTVDLLLNEIARRRAIAGGMYPYRYDENGLALERTDSAMPYLFMLCISTSLRFRSEDRYAEIDLMFDYLVRDALKSYLGPTASGLRFGSPASDNRPFNFRHAIGFLAEKLRLPRGPAHTRSHTGDAGLDIIAWRSFRDQRSAFSVILAQCTVQIDWYPKAKKDLNVDQWRGWIDFAKDPLIAIAIPFVIPLDYEKWDALRRLVHIVLDRLRVCELLEGVTLEYVNSMAEWVERESKLMLSGTEDA